MRWKIVFVVLLLPVLGSLYVALHHLGMRRGNATLAPPGPTSNADSDWADASKADSLEGYLRFLESHPEDVHAPSARASARKFSKLKFQEQREGGMLTVTEGFDYRKDRQSSKDQLPIEITGVDGAIFRSKGGLAFFPTFAHAVRSGSVGFESITDAIGQSWSFDHRDIVFLVQDCEFRTLMPRAHVWFEKDGVSLSGFEVRMSSGVHSAYVYRTKPLSLGLAIQLDDAEAAKRFLTNDSAQISAPDQKLGDMSPLGFAACHDSLNVAKLLLDRGADVNAKDGGG